MNGAERPWQQPSYGEIVAVERNLGGILVSFANGDEVPIELAAIGVEETAEVGVDEEGAALIARGDAGERQIDWMLIRRLEDPRFAEWLRERDLEEAKRIGRRLRALRINRGVSQKDAAAMAEMSAPQLAKIEKGESDLRISTVRAVLRAIGGSFAEIAGPDAPEVPVAEIQDHARESGVPKELLKTIAERLDTARFAEVLAHGFGWDAEVLLREAPQTEPVTEINFKTRDLQRARSSPLSRLAFTVAEVASGAFEGERRDLPEDPAVIRQELGGEVSLQSLLRWSWDRGVLVVPTPGTRKAFEGAAMRPGGGRVAVLSSAQAPIAFWLFDLAHELGHLALDHGSEHGVVDGEKPGRIFGDEDEEEANRFASDLLVPDMKRLFADLKERCAGPLDFQKRKFKWLAIDVAKENEVDPAVLLTTAAWALTDVAEPVDRWGSAYNYAKEQGEARPLVQAAFAERIDLDTLEELDRALIEVVVLE